jgi:flagellar basal-body rod protein FlgF
MNIGLYQSAASLTALERWQDAVSQNITASGVTGFKKRTVEFSGMAMGEITTGRGANTDTQPALMPKATYGISFQPGETAPTGRALDVALQGDGFLKVQNADGGISYTRGGELHIRPDRTLVTKDGLAILSTDDNPIKTQADGGEPIIDDDGTVKQGTTTVAKIGVFHFANNASLTPTGNGNYTADPAAPATLMENPSVLQGYLEGSNVSALKEMVSLVQIARAYEANQKILTTSDQTLQKALETLG